MGVLKKLKDIFYDEEIIEEEEMEEEKPKIKEIIPNIEKKEEKEKDSFIKRQPTEEIEIPRFEEPRKVNLVENISKLEEDTKAIPERELFQSKKTFNFPILDDEEEKPKTRSNINVMEMERKQKETRKIEEDTDTNINSNFKPSPVISPVYGILDKNFKKEDIISRNKQIEKSTRSSSSIAYDTVRKKAYGTLEDDFEGTLGGNSRLEAQKILDEVNNIEEELSNLDTETRGSYTRSNIEDLEKREKVTIGEMEEQTKRIELNNDVEDITREVKIEETSRIEKYKKDVEPEKKKISDVGDKTLEHDLFNLIDSMYDEEEE